jgi:hypothetical protein
MAGGAAALDRQASPFQVLTIACVTGLPATQQAAGSWACGRAAGILDPPGPAPGTGDRAPTLTLEMGVPAAEISMGFEIRRRSVSDRGSRSGIRHFSGDREITKDLRGSLSRSGRRPKAARPAFVNPPVPLRALARAPLEAQGVRDMAVDSRWLSRAAEAFNGAPQRTIAATGPGESSQTTGGSPGFPLGPPQVEYPPHKNRRDAPRTRRLVVQSPPGARRARQTAVPKRAGPGLHFPPPSQARGAPCAGRSIS